MINDEATREFLVESHEGLDQLDREFVALEENPSAPERIGTIFRIIHTIKGTSGFLGYSKLEALTHAGESLLSLLRDGSLALTPAMTTALLSLVDRVRASLRMIEIEGRENPDPSTDLMSTLAGLRSKDSAPKKAAPRPRTLESAAVTPAAAGRSATAPAATTPAVAATAKAATMVAPPPTPLSARDILEPAAEPGNGPRRDPESPAKSAPAAGASAAPTPSREPAAEAPRSTESAISDSNVRVDVGLLDKLMNLVGELVLARNQILQVGARLDDAAFVAAGQRLNLITTELQEQVMRTRMQPIGNVWSKLPRVVRDLAVACGKQVRVEMIGKETELDRTILEAIKDPLTHIVRNAVDHGLEAPELRAQRGKARTGSLILKAYHQGGQVNIEISDDGGGLNLERVKQKAVERNLLTAADAEKLSDYEATQLVFLPGLSTAEKVTNVSGRGVGMDVVKTNIERIGGTIDLTSRPQQGTTLKIRIPLTLAIVPTLVITSGAQRFAIPQTNLLELVRLEGEEALLGVENLHGAPVHRLRGQLLPLVYLNKALGLPTPAENPDQGPSVNIIVLQADDARFGLVVDEVLDTEEIVVKPLGRELMGIALFAGATIMGDGHVALILDIAGLAHHANAVSRSQERHSHAVAKPRAEAHADSEDKHALMLFTTQRAGIMALPLSMVARLEEFSPQQIERSGDRRVVQYRGEILTLIDLADHPDAGDGATIPVIVYSEGGRSVGFVVGRVLDVVEEAFKVDRRAADSGVLGTAIIQGRVTELLDVQGLIRRHASWLFEEPVPYETEAAA